MNTILITGHEAEMVEDTTKYTPMTSEERKEFEEWLWSSKNIKQAKEEFAAWLEEK